MLGRLSSATFHFPALCEEQVSWNRGEGDAQLPRALGKAWGVWLRGRCHTDWRGNRGGTILRPRSPAAFHQRPLLRGSAPRRLCILLHRSPPPELRYKVDWELPSTLSCYGYTLGPRHHAPTLPHPRRNPLTRSRTSYQRAWVSLGCTGSSALAEGSQVQPLSRDHGDSPTPHCYDPDVRHRKHRLTAPTQSQEKETAAHFSILAWRTPWTGEPGGLRSVGSQSRTQLSTWHMLSQALCSVLA